MQSGEGLSPLEIALIGYTTLSRSVPPLPSSSERGNKISQKQLSQGCGRARKTTLDKAHGDSHGHFQARPLCLETFSPQGPASPSQSLGVDLHLPGL